MNLGNEHTLPAKQMGKLRSSLPGNVKLIRQKSAWNNAALFAQVICWLGVALAPWMDLLQPILSFDAHKLYLAACVFKACVANGIWPLVIPKSTTWYMQPLDVAGFGPLKSTLRELFQAARAKSKSRDLSIHEFLPILCSAIRNVLQGRKWADVFEAVGYGSAQQNIRRRMLEEIGADPGLVVSSARPSDEQLRACLSKNMSVPARVLLQCVAEEDEPQVVPSAGSSGGVERSPCNSEVRHAGPCHRRSQCMQHALIAREPEAVFLSEAWTPFWRRWVSPHR